MLNKNSQEYNSPSKAPAGLKVYRKADTLLCPLPARINENK